jgi:hypothetical protein
MVVVMYSMMYDVCVQYEYDTVYMMIFNFL